MLTKSEPEHAKELMELAQKAVDENWKIYQKLATD
jgi:hypothetical protein